MLRKIALLLTFAFTALTLGFGFAHEGATGPVGERMRAMSEMGRALKTLHLAAKKRELMGNEMMEQHIALLREKAVSIPQLFEQKATMPISDALPEIWDTPEKFHEVADAFATLVDALQTAHESGDRPETIQALAEVTRSCGECHQAFRE